MKKHLFLGHDLETLKKDITGSRKSHFKRLYEQCRVYATQNLTEEHPNGSSTFMGMGAANLSLAYLLTDQEHYLEEAKRWIFTGVNYPHWGHAHLVDVDLSASWLMFGYSVCYDWLKDSLTEEERTTLREKLILQGNRMYKFYDETKGEGWATAYWQNHNWINLTGLAALGYALGDECEHSQTWIDAAKDNFEVVYDVMADDGSDYEGVVYWRYGAMWLLMYAHLLNDAEGFNYFETSGFLKNTFEYRLYQSVPNLQEAVNFGDAHDRKSGHSVAMYYKFAAEYNNGHAQKLGNRVKNDFLFREYYESGVKPGILPEAWLEYIWYDPSVEEEEFDTLPTVKHWEDLGLVVIRSSWDEDAVHMSFKCGEPGGKKQWKRSWEIDEANGWKTRGLSHQHPDNNSFILHAYDSYLAVDDGYNRTVKACEHNVVIVDGCGYEHEGGNNIWKETTKDTVADIEEFITEEGLVYTVGETAKMYKKDLELTRFARHMIYTDKGHFYMIDDLQSNKEHTYSWLMNADTTAKEVEGKLVVEAGPAKLELFSLEPATKTINNKETVVRAVMTTQEPDKFRETKMKTIIIENEVKAKDMMFFNILKPQRTFAQEEFSVEELRGEGFFGSVVITNEYKEIFLYNKNSKNIEAAGVTTDAQWVVVRIEGEKVTGHSIFKGTELNYNGKNLVKSDSVTTVIKMK